MFAIFGNREVLDEASVDWFFDLYAWALRNFDPKVFYQETILVLPTNEHFPGREASVHGMATLIFEQVKRHAGLAHWPTRLQDQNSCSVLEPPRIAIEGALWGSQGIVPQQTEEGDALTIAYHPQQVGDPQSLIATYAHTLAHYMGSMAQEAPPQAEGNWPHLTEVLAVFMGFGVMFANTALNIRTNRCGSCGVSSVGRSSYLSQYDITYALAIFCALKQIPAKAVIPQLKKSLRGYFKRALKDVQGRAESLADLRGIGQQPGLALGSAG